MLIKSLFAFLVGGAICAAAQIFIDKTKLTPAKILVSLVIFGVILGGIGLYQPIFDFCGCGISLPLVGFGANVAKGVRDAVSEMGFLGIFKGPFTAMSAGATVALLCGFIASLIFRGKSKKL